jgi:predicted DsbA family dithiol-disulfide isomerase
VSGQLRIELYVDTCCPFAWIGYQWLAEVGHRAVELALHLVSLPMLNERESISIGYQPLLAHTWKPARVPTQPLCSMARTSWHRCMRK